MTSTSKPGQGKVVAAELTREAQLAAANRAREDEQGVYDAIGARAAALVADRPSTGADEAHSGEWRQDGDFVGQGLKVTLRRAKGVTAADVLTVPLKMQVPPVGELAREWGVQWSKFTTLRVGERSTPQGSVLQTLELSTILMDAVAQADSMGVVVWPHAPEPQRILRELRWIMGEPKDAKSTPFRLTISELSVWDEFLVNGLYVLTRVRATQKQVRGTEYVDLTFEEYDRLDVETRALKSPSTGALKSSSSDDDGEQWAPLNAGDTLYKIATKYLRSPSKASVIARANGIPASVAATSPQNLADWAKRHDRKALKIPGGS